MLGRFSATALAGMLLLWSGSPARAATFDPKAHTEVTAECFGIYMTLDHAGYGLKPDRDGKAHRTQAYRGAQRIKPYLEAAVRVVGSDVFYRRSVLSRRTTNLVLDALDAVPVNPARRAVAQGLAADAAKCDRRLDAWGAPPFRGELPPPRTITR